MQDYKKLIEKYEKDLIRNRRYLLSLEYSSLKQFRQSLWLTDIFLST